MQEEFNNPKELYVMSKLRQADINKLAGVHPHLISVVERARESHSFIVTEGLRTIERQRELVAKGLSKTLNSRHLTGHAVDLAPWMDRDGDGAVDSGEVLYDWPLFFPMADAVKKAAEELSVEIVWGGAWKNLRDLSSPISANDMSRTFPDGPHFELDRSYYK